MDSRTMTRELSRDELQAELARELPERAALFTFGGNVAVVLASNSAVQANVFTLGSGGRAVALQGIVVIQRTH